MLPAFLRFTPIRLRTQHNGWSPAMQRRFILALARGAGPDEAARMLGSTRQSAYRLRRRPDGASFAAAWDGAQAFAREVARVGAVASGMAGTDGLLVPRYYRGRLIGYVRRDDIGGLLRTLNALDRLADRFAPDPTERAVAEAAFARLTGGGK